MEPDPIGLTVPALRLDGRTVRELPAIRFDGTTVSSLPQSVRVVGYALLVLIAVAVVALAAVPRLTPLRFYAVTTGSMVPALPVGTVTVVNTHDRTPRVGEIMAFDAPTDPAQVFTHRVEALLAGGSFRTEGDASHTADPWIVRPADVVGRVTATVPYASWGISVLKVGVLLALGACLLRFVVRRALARRIAPEVLVGFVLTGSLVYLFAVLRPVFGAGVEFVSLSSHTLRVNVINTGWIPIRAFSLANSADHSSRVWPNSTLLATLHVRPHAGLTAITTVKIVPAPSLVDIFVTALVVGSPFMIALVSTRPRARRRGRRPLGWERQRG